MKVAITAVPNLDLPAWPGHAAVAAYRMAGLAIAVGVPTLFWTLACVLAAHGLGISIGAPALLGVGVSVAAWCLVTAPLVMGNRR